MLSSRFFLPIFFLLALGIVMPANTHAFWGFGSKEGKSGLSLDQGYDLNTVTTIKGKVTSIVPGESDGPITITVRQDSKTFYVITAPRWYWFDRGIAVKANDELVVSGSKAQGKDGAIYILSSKITNVTTGDSVTVRTETGRPYWRGGGRMGGTGNGMQRRYGGGMRGRRESCRPL
jgi:hypothetical protein